MATSSDADRFTEQPLAQAAPATASWLSLLADNEAQVRGFQPHPGFGAAPEDSAAQPDPEPEVDQAQLDLVEAYDRGLADGLAQANEQAEQEMSERRRLGIAMRRLEIDMRDNMAAMLAQTVKTLCEASFAPIALDGDLLQKRCERAAAMLEEAQSDITLRLSPADIARLDDAFRSDWTIAPDPELPQGELRVEGRDGAVLDGPREWSRALAEALEIC